MKNIAIAAIAALSLAACGGSETEPQSSTTPIHAVADAVIVASGSFEGRSDHVTTGGVTIRKAEDGYYVVLADDFSLDGAPDPKLGFGNPEYVVQSQFSALNNKTGAQTYKLPDNIDPMEYSQIYVWCEKFSVPLGVASLQ